MSFPQWGNNNPELPKQQLIVVVNVWAKLTAFFILTFEQNIRLQDVPEAACVQHQPDSGLPPVEEALHAQ